MTIWSGGRGGRKACDSILHTNCCLHTFQFRASFFPIPYEDKVRKNSRLLHNESLVNLYQSPNIVRVIKSRIIWAGHVACLGVMRN